MKRAFGLAPDADEYNDYNQEEAGENYSENAATSYATDDEEPRNTGCSDISCPESVERDTSIIFEGVVEVINRHMPEFVKECLNEESERKLLFERLDSSVKEYLDRLMSYEAMKQRMAVSDERSKMKTEIENLRAKSRRVEEANEESTRQRLSAERQKRALSERVHDLESQVAHFEAEREQFDLENKSLVNKVRALTVQEGDNEALKEELNNMRAELSRMRAGAINPSADTTEPETANTSEDATLREKIDALQEQVASLEQAIASARTENEELRQANDNLRVKNDVSDAMINDYQSRTAEDSKKIEELTSQVQEAASQVEELTSQVEESNRQFEVLNEISEELDKLEEAKKKDADRISRLTDENQELKDLNERLMSELSAVKEQLTAASVTSETVAEYANEAAEDPKDTPKRKRRGLKMSPKITAIDETLNDTDWLVSTPPAGTSLAPKVELEDFGYKEPTKKPSRPENPAQTSLW
ncbi:MAG: hypothetical protein K2M04_06235 [Muribaculaceae bacterium]|nr:hypothetical protein [Muribaculaceae bacterium]